MEINTVYYDTYTHWNKFSQYTTNPIFLEWLDLWYTWHGIEDKDVPLMSALIKAYSGSMLTRHVLAIESGENTVSKIIGRASNHGRNHATWWCVLHDCVASSVLLMAPLISLAENKTLEELYILRLASGKKWHYVISDKYVQPNTKLCFGMHSNDVVIYDLILPTLMKFSDVHLHSNLIVTYCENVYEYFDIMGGTCLLLGKKYTHLPKLFTDHIARRRLVMRSKV